MRRYKGLAGNAPTLAGWLAIATMITTLKVDQHLTKTGQPGLMMRVHQVQHQISHRIVSSLDQIQIWLSELSPIAVGVTAMVALIIGMLLVALNYNEAVQSQDENIPLSVTGQTIALLAVMIGLMSAIGYYMPS